MPTYNDEDTIVQAIESLYRQNYNNWELIIVNDGGTSLKFKLSEFLKDSRIVLIENSENKGQIMALKTAIPYITGELVTMLHSDDQLVPNQLLSLTKLFQNSTIDGIFCDLRLINSKGIFTGKLRVIDKLSKYSDVDVLMRKGSTGLVTDIFFVTKKCFDTYVVSNYLEDGRFYWLNNANNSQNVPKLIKASSWYSYRISPTNYINSDTCKFLMVIGRLNIVTDLARTYQIPLEKIQSLFWRLFYKMPIMKMVYSYTYRPYFIRIADQTNLNNQKYLSYLQTKFSQIIKSVYGYEKSVDLKYIQNWFLNCHKNKTLVIYNESVETYNFLINIPINSIDFYNKLKERNKDIIQTLNILSNGITKITTDDVNLSCKLETLMHIIGLPIVITLKE